MIMTVHDEIVFEVKHERLVDAMPIIIEAMESPWKMAKWKIPLVVEPLLGLTWEAKVDWHAMVAGKEKIPDWLQGIIDPSQLSHAAHSEASPDSAKPAAPAAPVPSTTPVTPAAAAPKIPERKRESTPPGTTKGTLRVATFALASTYLTNRMVDLVFESVAGSLDPETDSIYLRLVDNGGNVLLDPSHHRLPILPEKLKLRFQDRNLGTGEFDVREEPL
jgi:hypothetical protein